MPRIEPHRGILDRPLAQPVTVLLAGGVESGVKRLGSEFQNADIAGEDGVEPPEKPLGVDRFEQRELDDLPCCMNPPVSSARSLGDCPLAGDLPNGRLQFLLNAGPRDGFLPAKYRVPSLGDERFIHFDG